MLFGKKKATVLDRRINELRKEMERVRSEMKTAARLEVAKPSMPGRGLPFQGAPAPEPRVAAMPGPVFGAKPPLGQAENDLFAHVSRQAEAGGAAATGRPFAGDSGYPSIFDQTDTNPSRLSEVGMREKFANYFMAGHFQNLRPLRQENRIVRNKAVVMVILVLALILWLVYYLQTH